VLGRLAVYSHMRGDDKMAADLLDRGRKVDPDNKKGQLTKACNAVGDAHQEKQEFDKAIALFRKAAETGEAVNDVVYARQSIAACLYSQGKLADVVPELEAAIALPGISKEDKEQSEGMLKQVQQQLKQQEKGKKDKDSDK